MRRLAALSLFVLLRASAPADEPALADMDLHLHDAAGQAATLRPQLGKRLTWVNLWASWCEPCRKEMPRLSELHKRYQDKGFRVVGVAVDQEPKKAREFLKKHPVAYPVLYGGQATLDELTEEKVLPITVVLDGKGAVEQVLMGALDEAEVQKLVQRLK
jgi:thiol-disulfide isomerase/thioredoxin